MKMSRFVHLVGNDTVWHSLLLKQCKVDHEIYLAFEKARDAGRSTDVHDIHQKSIPLDYLVVSSQEDNDLLKRIILQQSEPTIQSLFLIITNKCNLNCHYCFYRANGSQTLVGPKQDMTADSSRKAVDLFVRETHDNVHRTDYWQAITFYGGEPLINLDTLEDCVRHIRSLQSSGALWEGTELVVNTNGLLVDDRFAAYAAKEKIEVQVSLDGPEKIHNIHRVTINEQGSFAQVVEAIRKLKTANANVVPMITVTEANIPYLTELVLWMAQDLGIVRYITNILMSTTGDTLSGYPERAAEAMLSAYNKAISTGAIDLTIEGQLQAFQGPYIAKSSCGASGRKLTVFPNGSIHTCQALEKSNVSKVGSLESFTSDNSTWKTWAKRTRFTNKSCLSCPVLGACGGGCPAGAFHSHGSINEHDPNHCLWVRTLFTKWLQSN